MTRGLSKVPVAERWADRICTQLGKSVESIIEVGRLLVQAKADLAHGEWGRLFDDELVPFTIGTAQRLMAIAEHPVLSNTAHAPHLPASWMTLYELTKAEPATLKNALRDGVITPDMPRKAVIGLLPPRRSHPHPAVVDASDEPPYDDHENDPEQIEGAFLVRAETAANFAFYDVGRGRLTSDVVFYAKKAAAAWAALAVSLETAFRKGTV